MERIRPGERNQWFEVVVQLLPALVQPDDNVFLNRVRRYVEAENAVFAMGRDKNATDEQKKAANDALRAAWGEAMGFTENPSLANLQVVGCFMIADRVMMELRALKENQQ